MKKVYYGLLSLLCAGLVSCAKDEAQSSLKGRIDVRVNTDQSLSDDVSRAAGEVTEPDLKDFALTIASADGEVSNSWDSFEKFEPVFVEVGTYTVTASYGEAESEGFDALSYLGSTNVEVRKDETAEAAVICTINKAKVSVSYTDDFKKYFSSYSAYVSSSKGNKVTYAADETRGAYFVPGDLSLFLELTRQGISQKITLNPKNFTAEVKHEYRLTMDVDASTASLNIIFNDNPASEENVSINISDEALNAAPPVFTPYGFKSGETLEVLEGETVSSEKLEAYLNAPAGLSKCELTTVSEALKAQGWPEKVDLINLTEEQSQKLTELGLSTRGLGANHDKIALIDFRNVLSHLYCVADGNDTHVFTLKATDALTKVSDDLVLNVTTRNNGFAITLPESVPYGVNTMTVSLNLEGDPSQVTFWYMFMNVWQEFTAEQVDIQSGAEANKYAVTLTYPMPLNYTDTNVKFKAEHRNKRFEGEVRVDDPVLTLSLKNGDADVWAKHVNLQVTSNIEDGWVPTADNVVIQSWEDNSWRNVTCSFDVTGFVVTGLTSNRNYKFRVVAKDDYTKTSNFLEIHTETELSIPNGNMEDWYYTRPEGVKYWEVWYACKEGEQPVWNTMNQLTTSEGGTGTSASDRSGCRYASNSGTIQTDDVCSDNSNYAALIRTIGWGRDNAASWLAGNNHWGTCNNVTAGELYLGSYDIKNHKPLYGYTFTSRPSAVQFMYKYLPKNLLDWFVVTVELKDKEGYIIAEKTITRTGTVSAYVKEKIDLEYTKLSKAAVLSIIFKSTGNEDCLDLSKKTDILTPPPGLNLSDGEYLGSQLYIDDIELIYE